MRLQGSLVTAWVSGMVPAFTYALKSSEPFKPQGQELVCGSCPGSGSFSYVFALMFSNPLPSITMALSLLVDPNFPLGVLLDLAFLDPGPWLVLMLRLCQLLWAWPSFPPTQMRQPELLAV